jgi:hypothetical protein
MLPDRTVDERIRCHRCLLAGALGQLSFFDGDAYYSEDARVYDGAVIATEDTGSGRPAIETSYCGRVGFWREQSPAVFGCRIGIGPLLVMPDTNILIGIRDNLDEAEGGLILRPIWGDHEQPMEALRELVQLWWWRDLRFAVSPLHLTDAPKPLTGDRLRAREDAVRELEQDFLDRGGGRAVVSDEWTVTDVPCALHAAPSAVRITDSGGTRHRSWPKGKRDRRLVEEAYGAGCHVFLTADKGVLRCHESLFEKGLAIMTPGQLMTALDEAGELEDTRQGDFPVPDLSALTRLYSGFAGE